jgi:hypothetical protein
LPALDYSVQVTNQLCAGEIASGEILVSLNKGTLPVLLILDGTDSTYITEIITEYKLEKLASGQHIIQLIVNNQCLYNEVYNIVEPDEILIETEVTPVTGDESNGSVSINISGGIPPYIVKLEGEVLADFSMVNNLSAGAHNVNVTDSQGCISSEEFIVEAITALGEDLVNINMYLYPNPATNSIIIGDLGYYSEQNISISVFNVTGRLLKNFSTRVKTEHLEISLSDLNSGKYIIVLTNDEGSMPFRFIVDK